MRGSVLPGSRSRRCVRRSRTRARARGPSARRPAPRAVRRVPSMSKRTRRRQAVTGRGAGWGRCGRSEREAEWARRARRGHGARPARGRPRGAAPRWAAGGRGAAPLPPAVLQRPSVKQSEPSASSARAADGPQHVRGRLGQAWRRPSPRRPRCPRGRGRAARCPPSRRRTIMLSVMREAAVERPGEPALGHRLEQPCRAAGRAVRRAGRPRRAPTRCA